MTSRNRVIVALDSPNGGEAWELVEKLGGRADYYNGMLSLVFREWCALSRRVPNTRMEPTRQVRRSHKHRHEPSQP